MYAKDPSICPAYYFYILSMYNPANVGSRDFPEDIYHSKLIRSAMISDKERKMYEKIRSLDPDGLAFDESGRAKTVF